MNKDRTFTKYAAGLAALAAIGGLAASWYVATAQPKDRFAACRESQIAGGAGAIGGPFTLVNQNGETVTDAEVITSPTLLYFGFTFCPDVCPLDNARNAQATDILAERGIEVTPAFISVDPQRDTPAVLRDYVANMHPRMIGLTGTEDQVRAATLAYKAYFNIQPSEGEFYLVDHSTFTYLILPQIGFAEFFRREVTADQMADRVACFVDAL